MNNNEGSVDISQHILDAYKIVAPEGVQHIRVDDWSTQSPQGIFASMCPRRIEGKHNGELVRIPQGHWAAFDPDTEVFKLDDGRTVKLLAPNAEYAKQWPDAYTTLVSEATDRLPREKLEDK